MKNRLSSPLSVALLTSLLALLYLSLVACSSEPSPGITTEFEEIEFAWIPAGSFQMGSRFSTDDIQQHYGFDFTEPHKEAWNDQLPLHEVVVAKGFWMATKEVTVAQFQEFVEATSYITQAEEDKSAYGYISGQGFGELNGVSWKNPGWDVAGNHPVSTMSLNDVEAFLEWYNFSHVGQYRLPTEEEWEYAARAGTDTTFFWGHEKEKVAAYANILDSYFDVDDGYEFTAPVGSFNPNPWNLYDMVGNVWEWTTSPYNSYDPDPKLLGSEDDYIDRGGGWDSLPYSARTANRGAASAGFRSTNLGFRLVRDAD